jgi:TldD protein
VALLSAPVLPPGRRTIVLHPSQLYLQIHESCGHPTELDRVFGQEAAYAGTSFLTTDKLDAGFRYGSDLVDIVADATAPGGMGTFGWDDEGHAQRVPLVSDGIFSGYLPAERPPAHRPPERRRCPRRGWNRLPLIRMTNINLEPRPGVSPRTSSRTPTTACSWRATAAGPSTTAGSTSSSASRSLARSGAARSDSSIGTPRTRA